jgi:hypothetical protein
MLKETEGLCSLDWKEFFDTKENLGISSINETKMANIWISIIDFFFP